jgi:putative glutamine amidotransferase
MKKPLIGITLDSVDPSIQLDGTWYAKIPWYAIRMKYIQAIEDAGGAALLIPYDHIAIETYAQALDGLVVSGGHCDIDPKYYGETINHEEVFLKPARTDFEWKMTQKMLEHNKPILGICGGMQLLNVIFGGSLHQHLPEHYPTDIDHVQKQDRTLPQHNVAIQPGTMFSKIMNGREVIPVNSVHHQGINKLGNGLISNAVAPDGLIEGIEAADYSFCLGVQWHPEFHVSSGDQMIFQSFINACD